ncbi:MAG: tyrosine-type recombinase/integrase [bacterium]|nr:tyrosine-type recombinase/integrase [bacterium]
MKQQWQGSVLAPHLEQFLVQKRALGRRYCTEEYPLHRLDRFVLDEQVAAVEAITPEIIDRFLQSYPGKSPRGFNNLLGLVRQLFDWLVLQERIDSNPVMTRRRRQTASMLPFIFDTRQARRLLQLAGGLPDRPNAPLRGPTYRTIFALLYGLGLRVGEVTRLCEGDVDRERRLLQIRKTKFSKSRLVPFGPRIGDQIEQYRRLAEPQRRLSAVAPVFSFLGERSINRHSIGRTFQQLVPSLELEVPPGTRRPCLHSLRHSFAVGTLLKWYRQGIEPSRRLLHLSTFLGHVHPDSTAVYLTMTEDLLHEAADRFERFARPLDLVGSS